MAIDILDDGSLEAQSLSQQLGLPLSSSPREYFFTKEAGFWVLRDFRQGKSFKLELSLEKELQVLRDQKINPKKDLLCRAVGFKGDSHDKVIDGTLGFGKDSMHLVSCGAEVIGFERNPLIFFLLEQSLDKSLSLQEKIQIFFGETVELLPQFLDESSVLYLDPMFENTKQKSSPKKNLAFLREVSHVDNDVQRVIAGAIELGVKRVVVKRPLKGQQLSGKPNIVYEGKLIRYDVYTR